MKVCTWNVNGIRARESQVLDLVRRERPDLLCLQEIKAPLEKVPPALASLEGYFPFFHGTGPYSGVALLVRREVVGAPPVFAHPDFDVEGRVVTADVRGALVASLYVPNGGKDFAAKIRFLESLDRWAAAASEAGRPLLLCGDLNVTREDRDVHPKERKPGAIGQRPEERVLLERILSRSLVDVGRALDPANDGLFTWWAPWRSLRQRNIGWRIDYLLASEPLARTATRCVVLADFGTSDHAPVIADFD